MVWDSFFYISKRPFIRIERRMIFNIRQLYCNENKFPNFSASELTGFFLLSCYYKLSRKKMYLDEDIGVEVVLKATSRSRLKEVYTFKTV